MPPATAERGRWPKIALGGALALSLAVYLLRLDRAVGLVNDDGWYVLLAKAVAAGQGYTLTNAPLSGVTPLYPPGFAWLLSLVFRLWPAFPQNVWALKAVSVAAMIGVGCAAYVYLVRERKTSRATALGISSATVLAPSFVFLATSTVMSECVFTLAQLLTVIAVERAVRAENCRRAHLYALIGGVLAASAFLTRSLGVGLVAAVLVYLLKERKARLAAYFALAVFVCAGPWVYYSRAHAPTPEQRQAVGGFIVYGYESQFWMKRAGEAASGTITARDLPRRVWNNAVNIFCRDTGGILLPSLFRSADKSGHEVMGLGTVEEDFLAAARYGLSPRTMAVAGLLSSLMIFGWLLALRRRMTLAEIVVPFSLAITALWPWWSFRFVLPLAPLLIYYLVTSLTALGQKLEHRQGLIAHAVLLLVIGLYVVEHASFIAGRFKSPPTNNDWTQTFAENEEALRFMREKLPADAVIATNFPALVHLYTGHKTIFSGNPRENWALWQRLGVRYIALVGITQLPAPEDRKGLFRVVYVSPRLRLFVLEIERSS